MNKALENEDELGVHCCLLQVVKKKSTTMNPQLVIVVYK